jgi:hypothetical protein
MPPTAEHCRAVRHTSDAAQSPSDAATHSLLESVHFPANAHCVDLRQSLVWRATQRPLSA